MASFFWSSLVIIAQLLSFTFASFCPEVKVIEQLDLKRLAGIWWVWDFYGMLAYVEPHSCHVSKFYPSHDGRSINVFNDYKLYNGAHKNYTWTISDENSMSDGNLMVTMKLKIRGEKKLPLFVLDTDYDRYIVLLICQDLGNRFFDKMRSALTLLRSKNMNEEELKDVSLRVEAALERSQLKREDLGLFHSESYTRNCDEPQLPASEPNDGTIPIQYDWDEESGQPANGQAFIPYSGKPNGKPSPSGDQYPPYTGNANTQMSPITGNQFSPYGGNFNSQPFQTSQSLVSTSSQYSPYSGNYDSQSSKLTGYPNSPSYPGAPSSQAEFTGNPGTSQIRPQGMPQGGRRGNRFSLQDD